MLRRRSPLAVLALLLIVTVGLGACGDDDEAETSTATEGETDDPAGADTDADEPSGGPVQLTVEDSGGSTDLAVGDTIVVTLPVGGGTGYSWQLNDQELTGVLELTDETQERVDPAEEGDEPITGAPEQQVFTFEAVGEGSAQLALSLFAPGNADEPEEDFTHDVTITG